MGTPNVFQVTLCEFFQLTVTAHLTMMISQIAVGLSRRCEVDHTKAGKYFRAAVAAPAIHFISQSARQRRTPFRIQEFRSADLDAARLGAEARAALELPVAVDAGEYVQRIADAEHRADGTSRSAFLAGGFE